ncbi:unnamed protein product [Calypogeia fissa]
MHCFPGANSTGRPDIPRFLEPIPAVQELRGAPRLTALSADGRMADEDHQPANGVPACVGALRDPLTKLNCDRRTFAAEVISLGGLALWRTGPTEWGSTIPGFYGEATPNGGRWGPRLRILRGGHTSRGRVG